MSCRYRRHGFQKVRSCSVAATLDRVLLELDYASLRAGENRLDKGRRRRIFIGMWVTGSHAEDTSYEIGNPADHLSARAIAEPITPRVSNEAMMTFRVLSRMVTSIMKRLPKSWAKASGSRRQRVS
jgi:hypothetical protein